MTPIEKNIIVVDNEGNKYEATYLKRAKGLVKNGRARFINETTICLSCPPNNESEDEKMSENTNEKYSINYCLEQIEKLSMQTEHINNAVEEMKTIDRNGEKALALGEIVSSREKTIRRLIEFYEEMYDDLKHQKTSK